MKKTKFLVLVLIVSLMVTNSMPSFAQAKQSKLTLNNGKSIGTMYVGSTYKVKVSGGKMKYYSSNKKVLKIGKGTGTVTPIKSGKVTIKAKNKAGKCIAKRVVKVAKRKATLNGKKVSSTDLYLNQSYKLNIAGVKVTYSSSKKAIATINKKSGAIQTKNEGNVTFTATNTSNKKVVYRKKFMLSRKRKVLQKLL